MAGLKTLMLRSKLEDAEKTLTSLNEQKDSLQVRAEEIENAIREAETDEEKETVEQEVEKQEEEENTVAEAIAKIEAEIEELKAQIEEAENKEDERANAKQMTKIETRKENKTMEVRNSREYVEAFADYIKDGEMRSIISENASGGTVAVPEFVEDIIKTAWTENKLMNYVRKTYLQGNVKVGFEISSTGAEVHTEGDEAIDEETLVLGIASLVPESIKKWITVSDEVVDLRGEAFLRYIYSELAYKIVQKAGEVLIGKILAASSTATSTVPSVQALATSSITVKDIIEAEGKLSAEATHPVLITTKATAALLKKQAVDGNFAYDPYDNLEVIEVASLTGALAIVGDLGYGAQANFPNGDEVTFKFDDLSLAEADLVKIVGREYVGIGLVACNAFCKITQAVEDDEQ